MVCGYSNCSFYFFPLLHLINVYMVSIIFSTLFYNNSLCNTKFILVNTDHKCNSAYKLEVRLPIKFLIYPNVEISSQIRLKFSKIIRFIICNIWCVHFKTLLWRYLNTFNHNSWCIVKPQTLPIIITNKTAN